MQLANGLIRLRLRAGLTQEQVGQRADYGKSTVSRYEDWRNPAGIRARTARSLAEACGATPAEAETLARLAEDTTEVWQVDGAVPSWLNPLVSLEHNARYEDAFAPSCVPGLLQTRAYALAIHQAEDVRRPAKAVERAVDARMQRQQVLRRDSPLQLRTVLDQAVFQRVVGNSAVMAEQIGHLIEQAAQPNIDIQILPFTSGAAAAGLGHFVTLVGADASLTSVYAELLGGGLYLDAPEDVDRYRSAFEGLRGHALSTAESLKIMMTTRKEYGDG
ncbi:helix-turn-helix transcriptional regulator [Streptomyces olivoreticuli]